MSWQDAGDSIANFAEGIPAVKELLKRHNQLLAEFNIEVDRRRKLDLEIRSLKQEILHLKEWNQVLRKGQSEAHAAVQKLLQVEMALHQLCSAIEYNLSDDELRSRLRTIADVVADELASTYSSELIQGEGLT